MEKYTQGYNAHDKKMAGYATEIEGKLDLVKNEIKTRVSVRDLKLNFKTLNDMLYVKF
jgi:hypothetical protein